MEYNKRILESLVDEDGKPICVHYPADEEEKIDSIAKSGYEAGLRMKHGFSGPIPKSPPSFLTRILNWFKNHE